MLKIADREFASRLLVGTGKYRSIEETRRALDLSGAQIVTVALRRVELVPGQPSVLDAIDRSRHTILPNTAGCYSADEAYTLAQMSREVFETDWIKLEVIGDDYTLQPDTLALPAAAERLIRDGFKVLPYCTEDLVLCRRLLDVGCQALMPWAAPIGTGRGPTNPYGLRLLRERLPNVPLIVDAGLGVPSHATQVMEWGYDAVLLNTAVAQAGDPVAMAQAFAMATQAGRLARLSGPMPERDVAQASTPVVGLPFWHAEERSA